MYGGKFFHSEPSISERIMTVDISVSPPGRDAEWSVARDTYYDTSKEEVVKGYTSVELLEVLDSIESELLPRLSKERDVEERNIISELNRVSTESVQLLADIAQREDVVRKLFKEYSELKATYADRCKRDIAKAPTWTNRNHAETRDAEPPAWTSNHRWKQNRTSWQNEQASDKETENPKSKWGDSSYSSGWGKSYEAKKSTASVDDDEFKPRWSVKSKNDSGASYDDKAKETKKWWEADDAKQVSEYTDSSKAWNRYNGSLDSSEKTTKQEWTQASYESEKSYRNKSNSGEYAEDWWSRRSEKDLETKANTVTPQPSHLTQGTNSWNRSYYENKELHEWSAEPSRELPPQVVPVALETVDENEHLPPHLISRLKIRQEWNQNVRELNQNVRPQRTIPPPPLTAPSIRVDNNGWGFSGAFH